MEPSLRKPELLPQPCAPPHNILQPPLSRLPLYCWCLHPHVWTGQGKCLLLEVAAALLQLGVGCVQGEAKGVGARWVHPTTAVCPIHHSLLVHQHVVKLGPAHGSCVSLG